MDKANIVYSDFVLYSFWRASCAWRVRLALNLKKIDYVIKSINLLKGEHKEKEYLELNRHGRLPCLEFIRTEGDKKEVIRIVESSAIIEFLEEIFPDSHPLLPKDPLSRAKIKAICYHIACNINPLQSLSTLLKVESIGHDKLEWALEFINKNLPAIEEEVKETMGKYCFGDQITMADIYLVPQLYFFERYNFPLTDYPTLLTIQKNLAVIEEFIKAAPENQPDSS